MCILVSMCHCEDDKVRQNVICITSTHKHLKIDSKLSTKYIQDLQHFYHSVLLEFA